MASPRDHAAPVWMVLVLVLSGCAHQTNQRPPSPVIAPAPLSSTSATHPLPTTAIGLYALACDPGSADGCNSAGVFVLDGREGVVPDGTRADALFQRACDLGSAAGCGNLGARMRHKDEVHAIGLLTRACDASWWPGCFVLGDIYAQGDREDPPLAAALLGRACKEKHQPSCAALGVLYKDGKGVTRNTSKAWTLFAGACEANVDFGCALWANLMIQDRATQFDLEQARSIFEKGCTDAFPAGCYAFALACANGVFGDPYTVRSMPLMRRACEHGYGDACAVLAKWLNKD